MTPLFNGKNCIGCLSQQYYNLKTLSCQNPNFISNISALKTSKYIQTGTHTLSSLLTINQKAPFPTVTCPSSSPLSNGTVCISCNIYNLANLSCITCPPQTVFNSSLHTCQTLPVYYPNLNSTTWIVSNSASLTNLVTLTKQRKAMNGAVQCPLSTPNYNNLTSQCLSCPNNTYWNYDTFICTICSPGMAVNMMTRQCTNLLTGVYQTNLNAPNLLYGGLSQAQLQAQQAKNQSTYPGIQNCPLSTPYFDGFGCISCPGIDPLFSISRQLCTACPSGSTYDTKSKMCLSSTNKLVLSPPNMGKMYSSIF